MEKQIAEQELLKMAAISKAAQAICEAAFLCNVTVDELSEFTIALAKKKYADNIIEQKLFGK